MMRRVALWMLCALAVVWPLGPFAAFFGGYLPYVLGAIYVSISIIRGWLWSGVKRASYESTIFYVFLLAVTLATLLNTQAKVKSIGFATKITGYWIIIFSVIGMKIEREEVYAVIVSFLSALTAVCIISILNYYDLSKFGIAYADERSFVEKGQIVNSLTGPHHNRTSFARHISIALPVVLFVSAKNKMRRYFFVFVSAILIFSSLLTLSRTVYFSLTLVLAYVTFSSIRFIKKYSISVLRYVIPFILSIVLLSVGSEVLEDVYKRASTLNPNEVVNSHADMARIYALRNTLVDLYSNPIGLGFERVYVEGKPDPINAHNTFTTTIRAAGIFGFLFYIGIMFSAIYRYEKSSKKMIQRFLVVSFFSSIVYGIAHGNLINLFFWIFYGFLISTSIIDQSK